jgi:hypothetical protein
MPAPLRPKETLLWTWLPMLATFAGMRLPLHLGGVRHIYPAGYLLHHLYTGALLVIPAAFLLAFAPRNRLPAILARLTLGAGSAMVLDEVAYLVATEASDADYVSAVSLWGAVLLMSLATALLFGLYCLHRDDGLGDATDFGQAENGERSFG